MALLDAIEVPDDGPVIATIFSDAGMGKTTLAASFPNPIFIRAENGLQSIPKAQRPAALPILDSGDQIFEQLLSVLNDPHDFKTLVIDSITALERLFIKDIMDVANPNGKKPTALGQALGGYGAGKSALATKHQRVRKAAEKIRQKRDMNVLFIAHADLERVEPPDQEGFHRYGIQLMDDSMPPYIGDVDLVGFIRQLIFLRGEEGERKKAVTSGDRQIICHVTPSNVSKNRYNIDEPIDWVRGENPLLSAITYVAGYSKPIVKKYAPAGQKIEKETA